MEDAPAAGAEYFEILARATNDAIRDWDVSSGGLTWPRGLESLLGHRAAGADKVSFWLDHIHPDDLGRIRTVCVRLLPVARNAGWAITASGAGTANIFMCSTGR